MTAMREAADEPGRAVELAERVVHDALAVGADEAAAVAERALGLAYRALLDVDAARQHLTLSIAHADRAGLPARAAEARLSLASELVDSGRPAAALRELGRASASLGDEHPQIHCQLALVYARFGRYDDALEVGTRALAIAQAHGNVSLGALILGNRGLVQAYRGDLAAAERDLTRAFELCSDEDERLNALEKQHNLGWVLTRRGRLPEALALFDEAENGIAELGVPLAVYRLDRAEALLVAGLAIEAATVAAGAVAELAEAGRQAELPEALLLRARAELLAGDGAAAATADAARTLFNRQDRGGWAALSWAVQLQAEARHAPATAELAEEALAVAVALGAYRLTDAEADARLLAGQLWTALGDLAAAQAQLVPLALLRRRRPSSTRARAWHAAMLLAVGHGQATVALRAGRSCLAALDEQRSALGATELHAASSVHGTVVAQAALAVALSRGTASVLEWSERLRTTTLHHPPARPPGDEQLATDLEQLRVVWHLRQQSLLDAEPSPALLRRQLALEESVRRRSRHAGDRPRDEARPPTLSAVRTLLDGRRLVSLFGSGGRLHALIVEAGRSEVLDCGAQEQVELDARHLRSALRRTVMGQPRGEQALLASAAQLDEVLSPALGRDRAVVLVPTPGLASVPWAALPSLADRDVEITPTLALWSRSLAASRATADVAIHDVVVAGPGLPEAESEARMVAGFHASASVLSGADATADRVLASVDGARLAHLACHGTFRAENPLFSSLLLHDGPLTVYDLERLSVGPEHVVLSACDSGRAGDRAGQELLGLAAAFFATGTRTLIASVVPVDDLATRDLMAALHRHWTLDAGLAQGGVTGPVAALRAAQRGTATGGVRTGTAWAFVCLTAGTQRS
jgi:hypothetical protein